MTSRGLRLRVTGREYGGWKTIRVTRSIEAIAGRFDLEIFDRWAGQSEPWPIREEDECSVLIDGVPIITGFVDGRSLSYDAESHSFSVSGRDRTGALVDCSAVLDRWEFLNTPVLALVQKLAAPFGISVRLQPGLAPLGPVAKLSVDPGETAFDAIDRACRIAGVLPVSDGIGGLVLARAGATRAVTELVEGVNIKAASGDYDGAARFRTYRVLGQHQGREGLSGASAATVRAEATDATVKRKERVLIVRADGNVTMAQAKRRAEWEATVRAARSYPVTVTVQGWTQGDGSLWPVNALVSVRSPFLGLDTDMLITETTFALSDSAGTTTTLALKRPDAFLPEPVIKASRGAGGGKKKKPSAPWAELDGGVSVPEANFSTLDGRAVQR